MSENQLALLTIQDVCQRLAIKESHLRSLVFNKEIYPIKVGRLLRFKTEELEKWLSERNKKLEEK